MKLVFGISDKCIEFDSDKWVKIFKKYKRICAETKKSFDEYIESVKKRDPAATSAAQILLLYSGVHALAGHRIASALYKKKKFFAARLVSQFTRSVTGVEIHPAATIGKCLFIDHGMGVVIGETAEIGDYCTIYQGATLGGTGKDVGKRHPTLGNNVMVGAGAKVLGPFKVGDNAKIAAGAVVLCEVPEGATAVGIPAKPVNRQKAEQGSEIGGQLDQIHIPDPISQALAQLSEKLEALEKRINKEL